MRLVVVLVPALVVLAVLVVALALRAGAGGAGGPAHTALRRALGAQARFHEVVGHVPPGPLRERLEDLGAAVDAAAAEASRVAGVAAAVPDDEDNAALRRLGVLATTLERAVVVAGELAVAGGDEVVRLSDEIAALQAALRELGPA